MSTLNFDDIEETYGYHPDPHAAASKAYLGVKGEASTGDRLQAACRAYLAALTEGRFAIVPTDMTGDILRDLSWRARRAAMDGDAKAHDVFQQAHHAVEVLLPGGFDKPMEQCDCIERFITKAGKA